jgi:DNA mismatch endonuclease (patch repair protein)
VADIFAKAKRSQIMSRIRGRDTKPELAVRSLLHRLGYRFRIHVATLPGKPDIVLPKHRTVVMVHGCFWHRHPRCQFCYTPKTRKEFWQTKFAGNMRRDRKVRSELARLGWRVIVIWECQVRNSPELEKRLGSLLRRT